MYKNTNYIQIIQISFYILFFHTFAANLQIEEMLEGKYIVKRFYIILRGGANSYSEEMIAANEKTFSSHDRKMKRIIPKHNESR